MEDGNSISIGPVPEKYLDLRPQDTYEENIQALEDVLGDEYEVVGEAYEDMHPRVFHSVFSHAYLQDGDPAKVDEEALEEMQEVLEENSGKEHFWLEDKLFNLGYSLGPDKSRRTMRKLDQARKKPYLPFGPNLVPEIETPMPENPVRKGRMKKLGDRYYEIANDWIDFEIGDHEIETV